MKPISQQRRIVEAEPRRHMVRRGFWWWLHWENLPWLESLVGGLLKVTGIWERGYANVLNLAVRQETLSFVRLPAAFDGFRILWISDIHADPFEGLAEKILELTGGLSYDICVLGGDYCFDHEMTEAAVEAMKVLAAGLGERSPVYAILGNHDVYAMGQVLERAGAQVLVNEHTRLDRNGQTLWLIGADDPHYYAAADMEKAMAGIAPEAFTVLLCHSPEMYRPAGQRGIDLYLAGHTHGGQVCLPNGFAPVICSSVPRRLVKGRWQYQQMSGFTSCGAGASGLPVRFNCPGDVVLFTLRKEG